MPQPFPWQTPDPTKAQFGTATTGFPGADGGTTAILDRMRRTSGTDFHTPMNDWLAEAGRIHDVNRGRRTEALGHLNRANDRATVPTLSDEDVRTMHARESDAITDRTQSGLRDLGSWMGAAGVFGGGLPTGLAASLEMDRMGQVLTSRADIKLAKARTDALDRAARWERDLGIGALINEPEDTTLADALAGSTELRQGAWLGERALEAQKSSAKSAKKSSLIGAGASVLSGLISAI